MSVGRDGASNLVSFLRVGVPAVEFGPLGAGHRGPEEWVSVSSLAGYRQALESSCARSRGGSMASVPPLPAATGLPASRRPRATAPPPPRKRYWWRFSLATMIIVGVTAAATSSADPALHRLDRRSDRDEANRNLHAELEDDSNMSTAANRRRS